MFERYTEKARRAIFFARDEAYRFGSPLIESEHLLLGLLHAGDTDFFRDVMPNVAPNELREEIEAQKPKSSPTIGKGDIEFSKQSKRILAYSAEEADRLGCRRIGIEHQLLGILREKNLAAQLLQNHSMNIEQVRKNALNRGAEDQPRSSVRAHGLARGSTKSAPPTAPRVDLYKIQSATPLKVKLLRGLWHCFQPPFFKHTPRMLSPLRIFLLRLFGARIGPDCHIGAGVKVWVPWNLKMGRRSSIGFDSEIFNFALVEIGDQVVVSQRSYICASTHDYTHPHFPMVSSPIAIQSQAWIAAGVFVAPGVTVGEGAVIGAGSVVVRSMPPWTVCSGNPCRPLEPRVINPID
jgi:putative colanic acid biosynthesis acetyltransferase WcaF